MKNNFLWLILDKNPWCLAPGCCRWVARWSLHGLALLPHVLSNWDLGNFGACSTTCSLYHCLFPVVPLFFVVWKGAVSPRGHHYHQGVLLPWRGLPFLSRSDSVGFTRADSGVGKVDDVLVRKLGRYTGRPSKQVKVSKLANKLWSTNTSGVKHQEMNKHEEFAGRLSQRRSGTWRWGNKA